MPQIPRFVAGGDIPSQTNTPMLRPHPDEMGNLAARTGAEMAQAGVALYSAIDEKRKIQAQNQVIGDTSKAEESYDTFVQGVQQTGKMAGPEGEVQVGDTNYVEVTNKYRDDQYKKLMEKYKDNGYAQKALQNHWAGWEKEAHKAALAHETDLFKKNSESAIDILLDHDKPLIVGQPNVGAVKGAMNETLGKLDIYSSLMGSNWITNKKLSYKQAVLGEFAREHMELDPEHFKEWANANIKGDIDPKYLNSLFDSADKRTYTNITRQNATDEKLQRQVLAQTKAFANDDYYTLVDKFWDQKKPLTSPEVLDFGKRYSSLPETDARVDALQRMIRGAGVSAPGARELANADVITGRADGDAILHRVGHGLSSEDAKSAWETWKTLKDGKHPAASQEAKQALHVLDLAFGADEASIMRGLSKPRDMVNHAAAVAQFYERVKDMKPGQFGTMQQAAQDIVHQYLPTFNFGPPKGTPKAGSAATPSAAPAPPELPAVDLPKMR